MAAADLEAGIARLAAQGDLAAAATEAIRGYGPQILGWLRAVLRDEEDAADVFSQFAEDLWRGLPGFQWKGPLRVWAYRVAWNASNRMRRDLYRQRGRRLRTTEISRLAESVRTGIAVAARREDGLERLRQELDPLEQTLLILRLDKKLSWREVAQVLAESEELVLEEAALRKRFERIKRKLAEKARAEGLLE